MGFLYCLVVSLMLRDTEGVCSPHYQVSCIEVTGILRAASTDGEAEMLGLFGRLNLIQLKFKSCTVRTWYQEGTPENTSYL